MADPGEVKKWFHSGPIDPISKLQYKMMNPKHRKIYNLFKQKQELEIQLAAIESQISQVSDPILIEITENPESPCHRWAWWEIYDRKYPKWAKEFELALGKAKADEVRAKYKGKDTYYLRVQFIHPRPPETK